MRPALKIFIYLVLQVPPGQQTQIKTQEQFLQENSDLLFLHAIVMTHKLEFKYFEIFKIILMVFRSIVISQNIS